jgi:hypothetical protein
MSTRRLWADWELRKLRELYPDLLATTVAQELHRPVKAVYQKAAELGLRKSAEFLASDKSRRKQLPAMIATQFQKGLVPWNKGMKGLQFEGSQATQFKKDRPAHEAHNYKPIGSLRVTRDGIVERKVSDGRAARPRAPMEPDRARAVAQVAQVLVDSARVEVDYIKATGQDRSGFLEEPPDPSVAHLGGAPTATGVVTRANGKTIHRLLG